MKDENDNIPKISKMQIDLMVNSFAADFARVATLSTPTRSAAPRCAGSAWTKATTSCRTSRTANKKAQEKLTKINKWFCEQLAYLAKRLAETPEPGGGGSLLDNTLIVWTNELGKGNSHTLDNIPFVLVGNGLDFKMGRSLKYKKVPHNRLLLSLAHGFGHHIERFGNPNLCGDGVLTGLATRNATAVAARPESHPSVATLVAVINSDPADSTLASGGKRQSRPNQADRPSAASVLPTAR